MTAVNRRCLRLSAFTALVATLAVVSMWLNLRSSAELEGRYRSNGQLQLNGSQLIDVSHSIQFKAGRFYAVTKQGDALLETSGVVEYDFLGRYRLRVEAGAVTGLSKEFDHELAFSLLYGGHKGSIISLVPLNNCLYGQEIRQLYCAEALALHP